MDIAEGQSHWSEEIRAILKAADRSVESLSALWKSLYQHLVAKDVLPQEMPEPESSLLQSLTQEIQNVRRLAAIQAVGKLFGMTTDGREAPSSLTT